MTIDDERSVYVGELPYDISEETLRKAFTLFGHVIAVKINNEGRGGKCYGFVTFTNPRSAVDAIRDMDGRTIQGRVVKVNDVMAQGGRPNNREGSKRNFDRSLSDRRRYRDREPTHYEDQHRAHKRDRSHDRGRYRLPEINHDQERDHSADRVRERSPERRMEEDNRNVEQEWERDDDLDQYRDREGERDTHHLKRGKSDEDQEKNSNGSQLDEQRSGEHSSELRDDDNLVEDELKDAHQRIKELRKEMPQLEELVDEKEALLLGLQAKKQELEEALAAAKKLNANRKMQLVKLARCYHHKEKCDEKLKSSDQELQSMVSTIMMEVEDGDSLY